MHPLLLLYFLAAEPSGEAIYAGQCAICHGQRGEGGRGAPLNRTRLRRAPDDAALQRVIRRGIPGSGMPATWLNESELAAVAGFVRGLGRAVVKQPVEFSREVERGQALYHGKARCARCHTLDGRGGSFGPDLTGIASRRSAEHLRESVVNPAAAVPPDFVILRAVTSTGRRVTGARVSEDTFSVQIRDEAGVAHSFWKTELRELRKEPGKTAMPSYRGVLSANELDDLVAYLARLEEVEAQ